MSNPPRPEPTPATCPTRPSSSNPHQAPYPAHSASPSRSASTASSSSTSGPYLTATSSSSSPTQPQAFGGSIGRANGRHGSPLRLDGIGEQSFTSDSPSPLQAPVERRRISSAGLISSGVEQWNYFSPALAHDSRSTTSPRYTPRQAGQPPVTPPPQVPTKDSTYEQTTPKRESLYVTEHTSHPSPGASSSRLANLLHLSPSILQSREAFLDSPQATSSSSSSHSTTCTIGSTNTARGFSSSTASGRKGKPPEPLNLSPESRRSRIKQESEEQRLYGISEPSGARYRAGIEKASPRGTADDRLSDPVDKGSFSPAIPAESSRPVHSSPDIQNSSGTRTSWFSHADGAMRGAQHNGKMPERAGEDWQAYSPYASLGKRVVTDPLHNRVSRESLTSPSTARSSLMSRYNLALPGQTSSIPLSAVLTAADNGRRTNTGIPSPSAFVDAEGDFEPAWSQEQGPGRDRSLLPMDGDQSSRERRASLYAHDGVRNTSSLYTPSRAPAILPRQPSSVNLQTPQHRSTQQFASPSTPGPTDPRDLDRTGLMGLGELATPRWATSHPISPLVQPRNSNGEIFSSTELGYAPSRRAQAISMSESYDSLMMIGQSPPMPSLPARLPPSRKVSGPRMRVPSNPSSRSSSRPAPPPPVTPGDLNGDGVGLGVVLKSPGLPCGGLLDIARVSPHDFGFPPGSGNYSPRPLLAADDVLDQPSPIKKAMPTSYTHTKRYSPQVLAGLEALREREQGASLQASKSAGADVSILQRVGQISHETLPSSYSSPLLSSSSRLRVRSSDTINADSGRQSGLVAGPNRGNSKREGSGSTSNSQRNLPSLATLTPPDLPSAHSLIRQFSSNKDFSHLPPSPSSASISQFMSRESGSKGSFPPQEEATANSPASLVVSAFPFPSPGKAQQVSTTEQRRRSQGTVGRTPKRSSSKTHTDEALEASEAALREAALRKIDGLGKPSMSSLRSRERMHAQSHVIVEADALAGISSGPGPHETDKGDRRRSEGTNSGSKREFTPSTSPGNSWHSRAFSNASTAPSSADLIHTGRVSAGAKPAGSSQDGSDVELTGDFDHNHVPPVPALPKDVQSLGRRDMPRSHTTSELASVAGAKVPQTEQPNSQSGFHKRPGYDTHPSLSFSPPEPIGLLSPDMSTIDFPASPSMESAKSKRMSKKWSFSSALNLGFSRSKQDTATFAADELALSPEGGDGPFTEFGLRAPQAYTRQPSFSSSNGSDDLRSIRESNPADAKAATAQLLPPRRTPSGIPFFRRSSSTSGNGSDSLSSKASSSTLLKESSIGRPDGYLAQSKKKVMGMGIPSMLQKSPASRRVSTDLHQSDRDQETTADQGTVAGWAQRKRGKTLTAAGPAPHNTAPQLPPMQMKNLPAATVQRVSSLNKHAPSGHSLLPVATDSSLRRSDTATGPLIRSATQNFPRTNYGELLPAIKGSPSAVGARPKASPSPTSAGRGISSSTPTRIPRISSKTSIPAAYGFPPDSQSNSLSHVSPTLRGGKSARMTSHVEHSTQAHPTPPRSSARNSENAIAPPSSASSQAVERNRQASVARAPATAGELSNADLPRTEERFGVDHSRSVPPRDQTLTSDGNTAPRRTLPDAPTPAIAKSSSMGYAKPPPPSLRPPQASLTLSRLPVSGTPQRRSDFANGPVGPTYTQTSNLQRPAGSPLSGLSVQQSRTQGAVQSASPRTTSPATSQAEEDERMGDREMADFLRTQKARKASGNWKAGDIDNFLDFPEPGVPSKERNPHEFIQHHFDQLSHYERTEIMEYSSVWFAGDRKKKNAATMDSVQNNYGYDDDRGDYLIIDGDHLAYRYEVQGILGKGSFGQVLQCLDHRSGEWVAVKIIRNKKRFHQQALTEIQLLSLLLKWDPEDKHNMIKMTEHFNFRGHLCIVTELLSLNLYELLKANGFNGFSSRLLRRFTVQLLASMQVMRANRVIHCDLKPENILMRHPAKSGLKVIDFGSSCFEHEKVYTYIQSRFYRSPEIILGTNYNMAIDMWSLGCILAEMYTGFPIFPGENEQEQLTCIMEVMGLPDRSLVERSSRRKLFFELDGSPKSYVNSKGKRRRPGTKTLAQVLKSDDDNFVDFIAKCLIWDPERRLKPATAMHHPWILDHRRRTNPSDTTGMTASSSNPSRLTRPSVRSTPITTKASPIHSTTQNYRSSMQEMPKPRVSEPTPLLARRPAGAVTHGTYAGGSLSALPVGPGRQYRASQHQSMRSYAEPARAAL